MQGGICGLDFWALDFRANGKGTMTAREWTEETGSTYVDKPITWAVAKGGGQTFVTITRERQGERAEAFGAPQTFHDLEGECEG